MYHSNSNNTKVRVQELSDIIQIQPGSVNSMALDKNGKVLGEHEGYPFYTIGQRRGLNLPMGVPVYVTNIDAATNTITIGEKEDLVSSTLTAKEINLVKYAKIPRTEMEVTGAIRYNDNGAMGYLTQLGDDEIKVHFPEAG